MATMVRAEVDEVIERAPATVFDFVAVHFFDNYPRWSPEVEQLEPLTGRTVEVGARARQVRVDHGRRSETTFCVTALEPDRLIRFEAEDRPAFVIEYRCAALEGERCRLEFSFELVRLEFYMRPFERLIRRAVQQGSARAVDNIKALIERER